MISNAKVLMFLTSFLFFHSANAELLKLDSSNPASRITNDGLRLQSVGLGLRSKKVLLVTVKVYTAQLYVSDLSKFKKTSSESLNSLVEANPAAIQMIFQRDVDTEKIQSSFKEALLTNNVDLKKSEIQKFLEAVKNGGEVKEGKSLTILGTKKADGSETLAYEDSNLKITTIVGGAGFIRDIFSIWLGKASDAGIEKLKAEILK